MQAAKIDIADEMKDANLLAYFGNNSKSSFGYVMASLQSREKLMWDTATATLIQEYNGKAWGAKKSDCSASQNARTVPLTVQKRLPSHHSMSFSKTFVKGKLKCWERQQIGHKTFKCPRRASERQSDTTNINISSANHASMLIVTSNDSARHKLLLDSGESDRMVTRIDLFIKLKCVRPRTFFGTRQR